VTFVVHQNHWQAVCGLDCKQDTRQAGDQAIASGWEFVQVPYAVDEVGMNLAQGHHRPRLGSVSSAELLLESAAVAFDGAALVVFRETQVQRAAAIGAREASLAGAESVDEPRDARERVRTKNCSRSLAGTLAGHIDIVTTRGGWTWSGRARAGYIGKKRVFRIDL
jgi:hypothetical protein